MTSFGTIMEWKLNRFIHSRNLVFVFFSSMVLIVFYDPFLTLMVNSIHDDINDYIPFIPLISGFFLYIRRHEIFSHKEYSLGGGAGIITSGVTLYFIGLSQEDRLYQSDYLSLAILAGVFIWIGGFALCYGIGTLRKASFPLLFLLLTVPIPSMILERIISILQEGSAEVAFLLFKVLDVPVLREGAVFHLTAISIEVAKQCSGIHSGIALLITSIVAGNYFLVTSRRKWILTFFAFPIAIVKNGLRIVTLSLLGNYVDERILSGSLHKEGGIPFFLLGLSLLVIVLWFLKRSEERVGSPARMRLPLSSKHENR